MASSTNLTTLEKVKAYLGLEGSGDDVLLNTLIASVSEAIEHYCGCEFSYAERTEFFDGNGATPLVLRCRPVHAVASVHVDGARNFPAGSELPGEAYVFYPESGIIKIPAGVPRGIRNVQVVYTSGFAQIPPALEQAATVLLASFFNRGHSGGDGLQSESVGAYTVSYHDADWPPAVRALLSEYRGMEV